MIDCQGGGGLAVAYKVDILLICDLVSKLLGMLPKEMKIIYNKACEECS